MGKGSRNRQLHQQDKIENPKKYVKKVQKKPMPTWAKRTIAIVLALAVVIGVAAYIVVDTGLIERNRVLVKSESGKFDVNQQMASFIAWQAAYANAAMYWSYCDYGIYEDEYGITDPETGFKTAEEYALVAAQSMLDNQLRDSVDDVVATILECVALCDAANAANVKLGDEEKESVQAAIDSLNKLRSGYMFSSLNNFLSTAIAKGLTESDVRDALELMELAEKYSTQMKLSFEKGATLTELEAFRNENPDGFFKTDYLNYAADDQAFADTLLDCTTPEEFKTAILEHHFGKNYKPAYNKFTTQVTVSADLATLSNKTNNNGGTALTEALNALSAEIKTITPQDAGLDEALKTWLFDTKRVKNETASIPAKDGNGMYIVAFLSEAASTTSVQAGVKYYEFASGESHEGNDAFMTTILAHIKESKKDSPTYPEVSYETAKKKAEAFETELKALIKQTVDNACQALLAEKNAVMDLAVTSTSDASVLPTALRDAIFKNADKRVAHSTLVVETESVVYTVYFKEIDGSADPKTATVCYASFTGDNAKTDAAAFEATLNSKIVERTDYASKTYFQSKDGAVEDKTITSTSGASEIPETLRDSIFAEVSDYKVGDTMIVESGATAYVVYFSAIGTTKVTIHYQALEGDLYYQIINDITSSLNSVYPTKKDQSFVSEPKENSFEEWINERVGTEGYTSARKEGDVNYFSVTTDGKTTYQVYMVINTPLYLDTDPAVYGGYYLFSGKDAEKNADDAVAALAGKEGAELMSALSALNSSATTNTAMKSSSVTDKNLNKWFFTDEHSANTVAKVQAVSASSYYVAVYVEIAPTWQANAKASFVTDTHTKWVEGLVENYSVNEKALAKLGEPTPETSGTETSGTGTGSEPASSSAETTGA